MRSFWGIAGKWDSQWVPPGASLGPLYELGKAILKGAASIPSGENMLLRIN